MGIKSNLFLSGNKTASSFLVSCHTFALNLLFFFSLYLSVIASAYWGSKQEKNGRITHISTSPHKIPNYISRSVASSIQRQDCLSTVYPEKLSRWSEWDKSVRKKARLFPILKDLFPKRNSSFIFFRKLAALKAKKERATNVLRSWNELFLFIFNNIYYCTVNICLKLNSIAVHNQTMVKICIQRPLSTFFSFLFVLAFLCEFVFPPPLL